MSNHTYYECPPDRECDDRYGCQYCSGGLLFCVICGGAEGSLTSECPGARMSDEEEDAVYKTRTLDFKNGKWFNPKEIK